MTLLRLTRPLLAACALYGVALGFTGHLLSGLPLTCLATFGFWLGAPTTRQDSAVTSLAKELRQAATALPIDAHRIFRSFGGEHDVIVTRSKGPLSAPHRFEVLSRELADQAAGLEPGGEVVLTADVYTVTDAPLPAMAIHMVESRRLFWPMGADEPQELPDAGNSGLRTAHRLARLNQKTGVMTPSVDELEAVAATVRAPEGTHDLPR